jgi:predicted CoA-binding protein
MAPLPAQVVEFLRGRRIAVVGVSRSGGQPANAIFRKFRDCGYAVVAVNPHATRLEGEACYPDLQSVPGTVDGVVVAVPPAAAADIVRQAHGRGITRVWFHRSLGAGSVSPAALEACVECGITPIVGGCPLMYLEPVDPAHRCFRWVLRLLGRLPG